MLGHDTPVMLRLLELPSAVRAAEGVVMELVDGAFPLLAETEIHDDPITAFDGVDVALLIGAKPRAKGMERADLLAANAEIFADGRARRSTRGAGADVRVLVVGNPANTNAMVAAAHAPDIPADRFTALTRLDHNRAVAAMARHAEVPVTEISRMTIWGNHSPTQYPDIFHAVVGGRSGADYAADTHWLTDDFIPTVAQPRYRDHRGTRVQFGGVGGQRRHRPHRRLGARHARGRLDVGGAALPRRLRRRRGSGVLVSRAGRSTAVGRSSTGSTSTSSPAPASTPRWPNCAPNAMRVAALGLL